MFDLKKESETKKIIFVLPSELKSYFFEQKSMDPFLDYKFFTLEELIINLRGDFNDKKAIKLAINELSLTFSSIKKVLKFLFMLIDESKLEDDVYKNLLNLLKKEKLIEQNNDFLALLQSRHLVFVGYQNSTYVNEFIRFFNISDYQFIEFSDLYYIYKEKEYYEFFNISDEIYFGLNKIAKDIDEGLIESGNVNILCDYEKYEYYFKLYLSNSTIPFNFVENKTLLNKKTYRKMQKFISDSFQVLDYLKNNENDLNDDEYYQEIFDTLSFYEIDKLTNKKENIKEILSSIKLRTENFKNGINFTNSISFSSIKKFYIFGMDDKLFPKTTKDNGLFSYKYLHTLGFDSLDEINSRNSLLERAFFSIDSINFIGFHAKDNSGKKVENFYFSELNFKKACKTPIFFEYFKNLSEIFYRSNIDKFTRQGVKSEELELYKGLFNNQVIEGFSSEFSGIENFKVKDDLTYSYSALSKFHNCPFSYYCDYMLKLNRFEDSFGSKLGSFAHKIFEHIYDDDFDFDAEVKNALIYMDKNDESFTEKEKIILRRSIEELKTSVAFALKHKNYLSIKSTMSEKKYFKEIDFYYYAKSEENGEIIFDKIEAKSTFLGQIDRVITTSDDSVFLIDYKTGYFEGLSKTDIEKYHLGMQLPMYLYLADAQNLNVKGMFISRLLLDNNNFYNFYAPTQKKLENLKFIGVFLNDPSSLSLFDSSVNGDEGTSEFVIGLKYVKDRKSFSKGQSGKNKVLEASDFNNFIKISDKFIKDSIEKINEGDFRIAPFKEKSQYSPCRFCQNKDICLFKDGDINETNS